MTDDGQAALGDFEDPGGAEDRPAAEAEAIAGRGSEEGGSVVDPEREALPAADGTAELAITQVDYTIAGSGREERPIVHVFGRTPEGVREHVRVRGFRPYFYAPTETLSDGDLDRDRITGHEEGYETIRGEAVTKIFGQTPRDVGSMRDEFDHYEADVLFPNRLLIDKDLRGGVRVPARRESEGGPITVHHDELEPAEVDAEPRVCMLDIEVDDRRGFPEDGEEPIVCLTTHDSYRDEYVAWLYEAPASEGTVPDELPDYEQIGEESTVEVRSFDSEPAMLDALMEYVEETDPDLMCGWNFEDFDAPYLLDRLEELEDWPDHDYDLSIDRLSRVNEVWRSGWGGPDVKGRVVFDLLYAYKRTQYTELESYRLDAVGEMELDVGKERYPGDIGDLWEQDPERLLEYNVRDVELCVEINREQDVIPFWQDVASFIGCKLEDAPTPGDAVDMYVLHEAHGEFVLPSKGKQEAEDFEGGAVFDPITGVRDMVSVLDLKCFSGDTDLLTPDGVRNVREVEPGDEVYTLDPDTFECEVKPVAETHEYENQYGELHHLSGNTHDFKITENHRFLYSKERGWDDLEPEDFAFDEYREITDSERHAFPQHEPMSGRTPERFDLVEEVDDGNVVVYTDDDLRVFRNAVPEAVTDSLELVHGSSNAMGLQQKVGKYLVPIESFRAHEAAIRDHADDLFLKYGPQHRETPLSFAMADWLELIGWFVTEGSTDHANGRITLHQSDADGRDAIQRLLDRMGINYNVGPRGVNVSNRYLLEWFESHCGSGYADKQLPEWVFDLDSELLDGLLETMIRSDGSVTESGLRKFWTKSDHLKRGIVDVAVRCGHKPTVSKQDDGTWYVSVGKKGSFNKSVNATTEDHDGNVYCVTAEDNHVVLAGRNGHFQWIGQSLYPMSMVTINASPETKVDPESYDGETYRTPTGVHFRKTPDGIIREMVDALLTEREEKKELRNEYDPDTEPYERYDRQQGAVKVIMNCFTPDTEVLTPAGVRNIRDLAVGDEVYSLDPDSMEMEVKPVTETHEYPDYRGELVDVETSKIDFRVTPNHRMLVRKNDTNGITEDGFSFVEAGDLYDYCHYEMPHGWSFDHDDELDDTLDIVELADGISDTKITVSDGGAKAAAKYGTPNVSRELDTEEFLRFLAWYITEGSVYRADTANYRIKIAQGDPDFRSQIESIVSGFVDYHYTDDRSVQFSSRIWADLLETLCGGSSVDKRIPDLVFRASEEQKREFLEVLIDGDGDRQKNSWRYSTISDQLKDDLLRLCAHLGYTASVNRDDGVWRIYVSQDGKNSFRMHRNGSTSTAENGVYCVTVEDNNTLLAGRNGKYQFVGNSLYGVFGWDRFRLYDREMSAGVTSTNREVISFTEQTVDDLGYSVTYGDSVTGDRPVVVRDPSGIVRIRPIAELFEEEATAADEAPVPSTDGGVDSRSSTKQYRRIDGWEALSLSEDGTAEWKPITQVIRHETDKQVVTLQHKFGESTTTEDHSYVVDRDGEYVESPPEDVEEPLRIPDVPSVDTLESIDTYEVLDGYTREYEDGRSVGTENATTKTKRVHADEDRVWFGHEHHAALDKTVTVQRHVDLTSEDGEALVRLLAAYVSEGSASTVETTDSRFGASISQDRTDWLDGLQSDYHRLFENTTGSVIASDTGDDRRVSYDTADGEREVTYSDGTSKLQMMNELAAVFFREFAGQTSRGKRVPSFVFHLPENLQDLFLDVLIEGDGSRKFPRYSDEYAERNFDFETTSRELAAGLSTLLTQRGRKHSLKYRDSKDSYTIRTCEFYRSGRDPVVEERDHDGYVYDLSVADNENFVDGVGGIVLHNTDSVMIELGDEVTKEEAIDTSFDIEEAINASYDEFTREQLNAEDHRFQIEFEKLYRRFFQAGKKKRYAGHIVWKEGKDVDDIDITGFEYQRSDIAPITKRVQREVIDMIVTGEDIADVEAYVGDVIEDFQDGNVDLDDVGIPGGIGKRLDAYDTDTAQVRGAKYANLLLGTNFGRGSKPKRLYLEKNGIHPDYFETIDDELRDDPQFKAFKRDVSAGDGVICFEYADQVPEEFRVDWDKMLDKTLKGPIARILEALDVSWEEVKTGQQQTGLGSFM